VLSDAYSDTPVPAGEVRVFFESDSLRAAAFEAMSFAADGILAGVAAAGYAAEWEADTIPVPTVYESVATLTVESELKETDGEGVFGPLGGEDGRLLTGGELLEREQRQPESPYAASPGEMIDELRRRAGELGATAIIVTSVRLGTIHALAIREEHANRAFATQARTNPAKR
jgi:hypothetical protein